jgi:alpha-L-rhamnosidase
MVEPDRVIATIKPVKMDPVGNGSYKVDMGRNFTGWLEIRNLRGSPGQPITMRITDDPKSTTEFGQVSTYICGEAPGTFRNRFNYAGGRYVHLQGPGRPPKLADIVGYAVSTDLERTGHFECSDELLNSIYETDLWTFRANTLNGVTMDCPHRERLGYGEVAWATAWGCGLPNYRAGAFYTNMIRNWCDVQHEDGSIWFVTPHMRYTWGGTLWSSAPVTIGWEMYRQYGDKRVLAQAYPTCKKWMAFLESKVSPKGDGVLTQYIKDRGRFLGDWAAPQGRKEWSGSTEALLFNNCVYALDLKMMTDIAGAIGNEEDAARYAGQLGRLRENIHRRFFDAEHNVYIDARQVHLAFPLYVGVVPEDVRPAVIANLKKEITDTRPYLDMGSSGLPMLLHYLIEDAEWNDILHRHLTNTARPGYGYFLEQDETTWPEYWSSTCASKIHTCYTGVASWFIKGLGGIRNAPEHFGYKRFVIKPHVVGDLRFARTSMESLYGKIVSNWKRDGAALEMDVEIPANASATVHVPAKDAASVTEGGRPAARAEGVAFVRMESGAAVFAVGSGAYRFASRLRAGEVGR